MKKQNKNQTFTWVYKLLKKHLPTIAIISVFSAIISLSFIALAFLSKNVLEIATHDKQGNFSTYALLFLAIIVLQVVLSGVNTILKSFTSGKFTISLREYLFSVLNHKKYSAISKYHSGDILNRFTSDTDIVVSNSVSILPDIFSILAKIIGGTIALVILEPYLAILALIFGVFFPAIGRLINKKYKYLHKKCQKTEGVTRSFLQECFENNIVIKTFKSEKPFVKKLNSYMSENFKFKMKRSYLSALSSLGLYSFFSLSYYAVLVWGASQIAKDSISFGMLVAFLQIISQLRLPLQNISGILPKYYSIMASAERLMELENLADEPSYEVLNEIDFESLEGQNVTFGYVKDLVLNSFNFKIKKGDLTAVIGTSGKGKSTLFKLILGLYELQNGEILINGNTPISANTRHLFAYVPQGNMILSGSIHDNLTMYNPKIKDDEIFSACKTAEIHDYITLLENGYDTILTERGGGLSEGQVQRLAIARALLANTQVLLLDEATSALDSETELKLLQNLKALKNKTVILVSHRQQSIDFCDKIITL